MRRDKVFLQQLILLGLSLALTVSLYIHEAIYDTGGPDPLPTILVVGGIYTGLFFAVLNGLFALLKMFIRLGRLLYKAVHRGT